MNINSRGLTALQKTSLLIMTVLTLLTFVGANLQTVLWQSSEWLVSTVLPAVVVGLTNQERAENSAAPLVRNSVLDEAAQLKAEHMARNEYFSHYSPDGVSPWYWFDEAGYVYAYAGENLAIHFTDSSEVVEAWMNSPLHRENIVNNVYTEIGVGTAKGKYEGYDTVYVVQLFGTPAVAPAPVVEPEPTPLAVAVESNETVEIPELEPELETITEVSEIVAEPEPIYIEEVVTPEPTEVVLNETREILPESPSYVEIVENTPLTESETEVISIEESNLGVSVEEIDNSEVVVIESEPITTSSGLAVAHVTTPNSNHAGATVASSLVTQPNSLLQLIYLLLAVAVVAMLGTSIVLEARKFHFHQVAYSVILLFGMAGLWYVHSLLTTGAVII